jgi:hypothetical protein
VCLNWAQAHAHAHAQHYNQEHQRQHTTHAGIVGNELPLTVASLCLASGQGRCCLLLGRTAALNLDNGQGFRGSLHESGVKGVLAYCFRR